MTFKPDDAASSMIRGLLNSAGLPNARFELLAASVENAEAALSKDNQRLILYNQAFLRTFESTKKNWLARGILAHELGHHLNNHDFQGIAQSRSEMELNADEYAGFLLYHMKASLSQALVAFQDLDEDSVAEGYPDRENRIAAVRNGWIRAKEAAERMGKGPYVARCVFYDEPREGYFLLDDGTIIRVSPGGRTQHVGKKVASDRASEWIYQTPTRQLRVKSNGKIYRPDGAAIGYVTAP